MPLFIYCVYEFLFLRVWLLGKSGCCRGLLCFLTRCRILHFYITRTSPCAPNSRTSTINITHHRSPNDCGLCRMLSFADAADGHLSGFLHLGLWSIVRMSRRRYFDQCALQTHRHSEQRRETIKNDEEGHLIYKDGDILNERCTHTISHSF